MAEEAEELREVLRPKPKMTIQAKDLLNTGSTLLNLALSGKSLGGFAKGHFYFCVGSSSSGKTFLFLTCLAEASINKHFDDYRFIHDDPEGGAIMDISHFFGKALAERIEAPPRGTSKTVEDFYYNLDDLKKAGRPFIYFLDSETALTSKEFEAKFQKNKSADKKGEDGTGSYGDGKPKVHSQNIRRVKSDLLKSGSILIAIAQERDAINTDRFGFGADKRTHSGGRAFKFYATAQLWSSHMKKLKKKIRNLDRQIGIVFKVEVKKNRKLGKERTVVIPIYHSYGIDDIGSCVDYLIQEGYWKKIRGGEISAPEFEFKGKREALVRQIEREEEERDLRLIVGKVWNEIEDACAVKRKKRYE